jgi:hypothetical protein
MMFVANAILLTLCVSLVSPLTPATARTRPVDATWQAYSFQETDEGVVLTSTLGSNQFSLIVIGKQVRVGSHDPPLFIVDQVKTTLETAAIVPTAAGNPLEALNAYRVYVTDDLKLRGWNALSKETRAFESDTGEPCLAWAFKVRSPNSRIWLFYAARTNGSNIISFAGYTEHESATAPLKAYVKDTIASLKRRPGSAASAQDIERVRAQWRSFDYSDQSQWVLNSELATEEDRQAPDGDTPILLAPSVLIEAVALAAATRPNGAPFTTLVTDGRTQHTITLEGYNTKENAFQYQDSTGSRSFLQEGLNLAGAAAVHEHGSWSIKKDELETVLYGVLLSSGDVLNVSRVLSLGPFGHFGMTVDDAVKTDFFTYFNLKEVARATGTEGESTISYRPTSKKFAPLVTVRLSANREGRLTDADLVLKRRFIEDAGDEITARDIAQIFVIAATAEEDKESVKPLCDEIFYLSGRPTLVDPAVKRHIHIPLYPSDGYLTFKDRRSFSVQMLNRSRLWLENIIEDGEPALLISAGTSN